MNALIKNNLSLIRVIIYINISIFYYIFLYKFSPLGINWRESFVEVFNNSIYNILNHFDYTLLGLTSSNVINKAQSQSLHIYPALHFIHFALIKFIFGNRLLFFISPLITNSIIVFSSILTAEITIKLLKSYLAIESFFIGISSFIFFLFSPWTYRMIINPHREIYFFLGLILSIYLSLRKNNKISKFIFLIGCFYQYQWGFLFAFFNIILIFLYSLQKKLNAAYAFLMFEFGTYREVIKYSLFCLIPTLIAVVQNIFIKIIKPDITLTNSSALYRIGVDSGSNIYHGSILGALQFLGGNRIGYCLSDSFNLREALSNNVNTNNLQNIFSYHCVLTILNCFLLSSISIFGISLLIKNSNETKKLITSLIFSIIIFISIFQQTWSAHLSYYSYSFSIIFAIGTTSFYKILSDKSDSISIIKFVFYIPIVIGTSISLIRSNYMIN